MTTRFWHFILISCISVIFCACGNKKVDHIRYEYNPDGNINYGYTFAFKTYAVYSNGKEKDITGKSALNVECFGATYNRGFISVNGYPERFSDDSIEVRAQYESKGEIFKYRHKFSLNYNGKLGADFSGIVGLPGSVGDDGGTALLFRWGKDGDMGFPGGTGGDGDDLKVFVWKDNVSGKYKMVIEIKDTQVAYYYSFLDKGYEVLVSTNGGQGGPGGRGGSGGEGKDGEKTTKKTKSPGIGGDGGQGGPGGQGGNGGSVWVYIHPNAAEIQSKIVVYNFAGFGGEGGAGGPGGRGGKPLEGQDAPADGTAGPPGTLGMPGTAGASVEYSIEEFDY